MIKVYGKFGILFRVHSSFLSSGHIRHLVWRPVLFITKSGHAECGLGAIPWPYFLTCARYIR